MPVIEHVFETGTFKIQAKENVRFIRIYDHHSDFWLICHFCIHLQLIHSLTHCVIHRMSCPCFYSHTKDISRAVPCRAVSYRAVPSLQLLIAKLSTGSTSAFKVQSMCGLRFKKCHWGKFFSDYIPLSLPVPFNPHSTHKSYVT